MTGSDTNIAFPLFLIVGFWLVLLAIGLVAFIFWIVELIDVARREFPDQTLKVVWVLVVFFGHFIGALINLFVGKPQGRLPGQPGPRIY